MSQLGRLAALVAAALLLVASVGLFLAATTGVLPTGQSLVELTCAFERASALSQQLDAQSEVALYRIEEKCRLLDDLLGGHLTLDEAAVHFRELDCDLPPAVLALRYHLPPTTPDGAVERLAVIVFAETALRDYPEHAAVCAQLRRELEGPAVHPGLPSMPVPEPEQ